MDSIGECVACICKRLEIIDAKLDNMANLIANESLKCECECEAETTPEVEP